MLPCLCVMATALHSMHGRRYFISVTMVVVYAVESQSGRSVGPPQSRRPGRPAGAAAIYSRGGVL